MKTAIEIGKEMMAAETRPMTANEMKVMMAVVLNEAAKAQLPENINSIEYQTIVSRLEWAGVPATDAGRNVAAFLATLCDTPAVCVLYAAALKAIHAEHGEITMTTLCSLAFPMGFPTNEALHEIWKGQKIRDGQRPDNMLDRPECWGINAAPPQPASQPPSGEPTRVQTTPN